MHPAFRIFLLLLFLVTLCLIATGFLVMSGERVGAHRSSTFGQAWQEFETRWGAEVTIPPPSFQLKDTLHWWYEDTTAKTWKTTVETKLHTPVLRNVQLHTQLNYGVQYRNWLAFNTYEATSHDTYVVENTTSRPCQLQMTVPKFGSAALLSHFTLTLNGQPFDMSKLKLNAVTELPITLKPAERCQVALTWTSKGMDDYIYKISAWNSTVIDSLDAHIVLNTASVGISSFGLPHTVSKADGKTDIHFAMDHFTSGQDIGLTFHSRSAYLDQVRKILMYSPAALALFVLLLIVFTQMEQKTFYWVHYLFFICILVFYFLFLSYSIRFFHVGVCILLSTVAMGLMAVIYFPAVLGRRFFLRRVMPFLVLLTTGFSLVFLIPVFQGISFLVLLFGVFLALMVAISKSDFSKWPLLQMPEGGKWVNATSGAAPSGLPSIDPNVVP